MDGVDLEVLRACVSWRASGQGTVLFTVAQTWGSSPRPVGAMMALRADGTVVGSVSGGCIEDDLIWKNSKGELPQSKPERLVYGVTADQANRFGLPCGGTIELIAEPLADHSLIEETLAHVLRRDLVSRELDLNTGAATISLAKQAEGFTLSKDRMVSVYGNTWRLMVIGAGQLSKFLCQMASGLGFDVVVIDPRQEYAADWGLSGVTRTFDMPDDYVAQNRPDHRTALLALTHDPKLDDLALIEALRSDAFYVGALGSRKNNDARRERFIQHFEVTEEELARLRGPVGIFIGSRTPPEIAVSILAEILAVKNGVSMTELATVAAGKAKVPTGVGV